MSNSDYILEYLEANLTKELCDDCISNKLNISPRQQVNQITRKLTNRGLIIRERKLCSLCKKIKLVNQFVPLSTKYSSSLDHQIKEVHAAYGKVADVEIDIEHIRTRIVRLCYDLWLKANQESPDCGISRLIGLLRDEGLIPKHQANMMLTLVNLRNVYVYDQLSLGFAEKHVAYYAWQIVSKWWEKFLNKIQN